jgi:GAF domain-containing protein/methylmalonyl-CoA mutase cobalamin-binding subunit
MVTHTRHVVLVDSGGGTTAVEKTLGDEGWHVIRTGAVADAMERAKRDQPSAVIFCGASTDAVTLAKKLRCNARTALLPVVIVSEVSDSAREELSRWGITSVLAPTADHRLIADVVKELAPLPPVTQAPDAELGRADRLKALERARLLDSPPEEPFDSLARFTGQLLDVPIVLMSLVDRQRQFFKAQVGLSEPLCATRETPITHSFCQWVVTGDEALVVEDARREFLLSVSPATIEMGVVAYAGVPIRVAPDETVGSFCAVDMKPRRWDARELQALHDVASLVQGLTALRQAEWLPPLTFDEFRDLAGATGRAVAAAMRLHEAGGMRVEPAEEQALLAIASGLGRDLSRASARAMPGA